MKRSGVLRPARAVAAVAAVTVLAACGGGGGSGASESPSAAPSESSTPPASSSPSGAQPGAGADGECGGGDLETQVVEATEGVSMTVPADWELESAKAGAATGLYPPPRDAGDGYLVVEAKGQTLDEAADEAFGSTEQAAEKTSEQELELTGFDGARMATFAYDDGTFSVDLVAVSGELRVVANLTREGVPDEQPVAESCLSSVARSS